MTSVLLLTDRPAFESLWSAACARVGLPARAQAPERPMNGPGPGAAIVIDAEHILFRGDMLLRQVGWARGHGAVIAVALPGDERFADREALLFELCGGLVARSERDVARIASGIQRRCEPSYGARFEFLAPAPGGRELVAIFGDGTVALVDSPHVEGSSSAREDPPPEPDGAVVEAIRMADDRRSAQVSWRSGATLDLIAGELTADLRAWNGLARSDARELSSPGRNANPGPTNGSSGLHDVDGVRLGQRLRALRIAAGLTQAELARRTGIHRPNIARVEAGRHTPSLETLARLAAAIGVSTTRVLAD